MDGKLLEDSFHVPAQGLRRNLECPGRILVALELRHGVEHMNLAFADSGGVFDLRPDRRLVNDRPAKAFRELFVGQALLQKAIGPVLASGANDRGAVVTRHHDKPRIRHRRAEVGQSLDAIAVRQLDVEQDHAGLQLRALLLRLAQGAGSEYLSIRRKDRAQSRNEDWMVLHDQDGALAGRHDRQSLLSEAPPCNNPRWVVPKECISSHR